MIFRKIGLIGNISLVYKILLGVLVVTVDVFGIVDVKEVKNQKYLDLGNHFLIVTPRRDHKTTYNSLIQGKRTYVTNRLFTGISISTLNGEETYSGGQCVQYVKYLHYPLKYGVVGIYYNFANSSQGRNIAVQIKSDIEEKINKTTQEEYFEEKGIRKSALECQKDDILVMNLNIAPGHIAILGKDISPNDTKISVINSNWFPFIHKSKKVDFMYGKEDEVDYRYSSEGWSHERFGIDNVTQNYAINENINSYSLSLTKNKYICLANPDVNNDGVYNANDGDEDAINYISFYASKKNASNYSTVFDNESRSTTKKYNTANIKITHTPWLYYLVDSDKDGFSINNETYTYAPDLLPVAPLKFNNENKMMGGKDSKYEIYVENQSKTEFKLYEGTSSVTKIYKNDDSLNFNGTALYKLSKEGTEQTQFVMIPRNGVSSFENQKKLKSSTNGKVLFSPTVIDDYYIDWSHDNSNYDTSKIKIGFWNSNGYDMPFLNYISGNVNADTIYSSTNAVNKYFMTLGKEKKAEWHFTLSGKHKFYVNIPTGRDTDIEHAEYSYNGITLKATRSNDNLDSDFSNWYILSEENGNEVFDLQGSESVVVEAKDGIVVVDALKLVATTENTIKPEDKHKFEDIKDNYDTKYKDAIYYLTNTLGILAKNNNFNPDYNITRQEFVKILVSLLKEMYGEKDVEALKVKNIEDIYADLGTEWFHNKGYDAIVVGMKIMEGNPNDIDSETKKRLLKPLSLINYKEASKIIGRAFFYDIKGKAAKGFGSGDSTLWWEAYYKCFSNENNNNNSTYKYTFNGNEVEIDSVYPNDYLSYTDETKYETNIKRKDMALILYRAYMLWNSDVKTDTCANDSTGWKQ